MWAFTLGALTESNNLDPLQVALLGLNERLENASFWFETGDQRTSIQGAVGATIEFLRAISGLGEPRKLAPFRKLLSAFEDLDNGVVPPLFRPEQAKPGRPEATDRRNLRACAAVSMELLCNKFTNADASRFVAEELQHLNIKVGGSRNVTLTAAARTIAQWRFRVHLNDDVLQTYKTLLATAASIQDRMSGMSPAEWKEMVLQNLRDVCVHMGLAPRS